MNLKIKNIDDYLVLQPVKFRIALEKIRQIIRTAAPGSMEGISYGMPSVKYEGRILMYFAGFKNHCSLFPGSKAVIVKLKKELKEYKTSAGTISFSAEKPLPAALVKKIVKMRVKENMEKLKKNKK